VAHALPPTLGKEPYRLFNLDVFEYELDHPMTVYGSVPFLHAHGDGGSYGALWLNPSEAFVDLGCPEASEAGGEAAAGVGAAGVCSHWFSASGAIDAFIFAGAAPRQVSAQHAALTGVTPLPPLFALGYHQCRWNYKDEEDVAKVHARFDEEQLPFDVLWLDIEHTDRKRYFTWNEDFFPDPVAACYLVITPCYLVINKRYPVTTPPRCACSRRSHALAARW
jgi:alpha 1,3-glucosidase